MLRRLECLYGKAAETAIFAAQVALDDFKADFNERGVAALTDPKKTFSCVRVGALAEDEANSVEELCRNWMHSLSSLYSAAAAELMEAAPVDAAVAETPPTSADCLPALVLLYVTNARPGLAPFFSDDVRERRTRRRSTKVHNVIIDFSGSHWVANFGTLIMSSRAASADRIKRRMLDLIVQRDTEAPGLGSRAHGMVVQHLAPDDPQISEHQAALLQDGLAALAEQSAREKIGFVPMTTVSAIGEHVLQAEARAGA